MEWINHHRLFTHIIRSDTILMALNLLLLLAIVLVPVSTSLLAAHIEDPQAAIIYSSIFVLMATFFNILWRYATYHNHLLSSNTDMRAVKSITRQYAFGPLLYIIVLILAYFSIPASLTLSFLLAIFFAIPARHLHLLSSESLQKESA